uniref:Uncharacterized protein n=1 Tax=viral metagenome TaxID=1070528 RepID=A0A6M3J935_9ZZZZ
MSYFAHLRITDENGNNIAHVSPHGELKVDLVELGTGGEALTELKKIRRLLEIFLNQEIREEDLG